MNEGFSENDVEKILLHVADDATWKMPGEFNLMGKDAIAREINNENFIGAPTMKIRHEIAEGDCVAVEGEVQCRKKDGSMFDAFFVDIYRLENEKIKEMRSYCVEKK